MTEGEPEILNIEQAARFLGVSIKTFNKVLHTESIPARKIGREWKFSRSALVRWVGSGQSDDFYRDSRAPSGRAEGAKRRTAGWNLELD